MAKGFTKTFKGIARNNGISPEKLDVYWKRAEHSLERYKDNHGESPKNPYAWLTAAALKMVNRTGSGKYPNQGKSRKGRRKKEIESHPNKLPRRKKPPTRKEQFELRVDSILESLE